MRSQSRAAIRRPRWRAAARSPACVPEALGSPGGRGVLGCGVGARVVAVRRALGEPTLAQLVLLLGRELAHALECFARGVALVGRHRRPVADALLEAFLLDGLHRGITPRGSDQALLL